MLISRRWPLRLARAIAASIAAPTTSITIGARHALSRINIAPPPSVNARRPSVPIVAPFAPRMDVVSVLASTCFIFGVWCVWRQKAFFVAFTLGRFSLRSGEGPHQGSCKGCVAVSQFGCLDREKDQERGESEREEGHRERARKRETETERERVRETDRGRERQKQRQKQREAERVRDRRFLPSG